MATVRRGAKSHLRPIAPKLIAPTRHPGGYAKYLLYDGAGYENRYGHELVLTNFVGPRPFGAQACHNNGIKTDNRLANLRWDTPAANQEDRESHGTGRRGKPHPTKTLTRREVRIIRALAGAMSHGDIGRLIGRPRTTVSDIVRGRTWKNFA
jgi:hypothetical protein